MSGCDHSTAVGWIFFLFGELFLNPKDTHTHPYQCHVCTENELCIASYQLLSVIVLYKLYITKQLKRVQCKSERVTVLTLHCDDELTSAVVAGWICGGVIHCSLSSRKWITRRVGAGDVQLSTWNNVSTSL